MVRIRNVFNDAAHDPHGGYSEQESDLVTCKYKVLAGCTTHDIQETFDALTKDTETEIRIVGKHHEVGILRDVTGYYCNKGRSKIHSEC